MPATPAPCGNNPWRRAAQHVGSRKAYEALEAAVQSGADAAAVAAAAKKFVGLQHAARAMGDLPVPFVDLPQ